MMYICDQYDKDHNVEDFKFKVMVLKFYGCHVEDF